MKNLQKEKQQHRIRRHARVRARIFGTPERPRVSVFRSNRHTFVQAIDDTVGKTIVSSVIGSAKKSALKGKKTEVAAAIGQKLAEKMKEKGITQAVFDKGSSKYHGRVKAVADGLRAGGIKI